MSILIPGMEMPKDGCKSCMFDVFGQCLIRANMDKPYEVTHSCPLIELPPHGRLIDADALLEDHGLGTYCPECKRDERSCQYEMIHTTMDFCGWIEDADTIIPASGGR